MAKKTSGESEETRAEVARRRLAQLAAAFDADLPAAPVDDDVALEGTEAPVRRVVGPSHLRVMVAAGAAVCVVLAWWLLAQRPHDSDPIETVGFADSPTSTQSPSDELVIDVIGKVKRPGIVTVPVGSRVYHAVEAAGGVASKKVDTSSLNMARLLEDGEQILVGDVGSGSDSGNSAGGKINLNRATVDELDTLPGVGPVTAQAIVAWRDQHGRFSTVDDLLNVRGIGEATLTDLRDLVTV